MRAARRRRAYALFTVAVLITAAARVVFAGNIDPGNIGDHFAWGENIGWINFKPDQGPGVTVLANKLTGFAWAENVGWINLSPMDGGVLNDGFGHLSGFAWGENVGWINFAPAGAGVTIDMVTGRLFGFAWGENIGWVNFGMPSALSPVPAASTDALAVMVVLLGGAGVFGIWLLRRTR